MIHDVAEVRIWGDLVGAIALNRSTWEYVFEYDEDWRKKGIELSPIHMPVSSGDGRTIFQFPRLPEPTFKGLPGLLADALPDDFGNAVINAWLASEGRSISDFSAVERLLYTGIRGMGALEFAPALYRTNGKKPVDIELDSLVQTAQRVLDERSGAGGNLDHQRDGALASIYQVGTSAGGARPKAVVAINQDRSRILSGQVDAPDGFEHYLLKFDGVVEHSRNSELFGDPLGYGLMEFTYYQMATACGITMEPCELLHHGRLSHFLTRRFDRRGNDKVHIQTLCAMDHADYKMPGGYSYEQLFQLARKLRLPRHQAVEIFRRMVFNVVARNQDDHTKNFAFMMDRDGVWSLAPAYDVAYSYKPDSFWVAQHNISLNGKRSDFTKEDLVSVGEKQLRGFGSEAREIIDEVIETVSAWPKMARENGVPEGMVDMIHRNLRFVNGK